MALQVIAVNFENVFTADKFIDIWANLVFTDVDDFLTLDQNLNFVNFGHDFAYNHVTLEEDVALNVGYNVHWDFALALWFS